MRLVTELGESPLLTNEDHHLIQAILESQHREGHTHDHSHFSNTINWQLWSAVIAMFAVLSLLHSTLSLVLLPFGAPFLLLLWRQVLWWWVWLEEGRARRGRASYYRSFDLLLLQLTATLRWLQEVEVIGQGFTRPFIFSRHAYLSCDWHRSYRHIKLRRQLMIKSSHLISKLRNVTVGVYKDVRSWEHGQQWLGGEVLDRQNYLAFTDLHHLHPHLTNSKAMEEEVCSTRALELDSLKVKLTCLPVS